MVYPETTSTPPILCTSARAVQIGDAPEGTKILVSRRWPRGLARESVARWLPRLAPGWRLDRAWSRGRLSPEEGEQRYRSELERRAIGAYVGELLHRLEAGETLVLVGAADEPQHCHRVALCTFLFEEHAALQFERGGLGDY